MSDISEFQAFVKQRRDYKKLIALKAKWQAAIKKSALVDIKIILRMDGKDFSDIDLNEVLNRTLNILPTLNNAITEEKARLDALKAKADAFYNENVGDYVP